MEKREYCWYVHTYSEIEGLQQAHTLTYCADNSSRGVVLELVARQGSEEQRAAVLCPELSFSRGVQLLRYLYENGIGLSGWLDVLEDIQQPYEALTGR